MAEEAKAREERMKRKDEEQIEFFKSFRRRNDQYTIQSQLECKKLEFELSRARGRLASYIGSKWKPDNSMIDGVLLNKREVLSVVYSVNETDGIYNKLMTVLGSMEHDHSNENFRMQVQVALDGYQLPQIVELPIEMEAE